MKLLHAKIVGWTATFRIKRLATPVFVGIRKGYLHPQNEADLQSFAQQNSDIVRLLSPIEAVNQLTAELEKVG